MDQQPAPRAERPRGEPEIIAPGEQPARSDDIFGGRNTHRIHVARPGPVGFFMLALVAALLAALVFLLVLGAFVILIPLAGLLLVAAVVIRILRGSSRRHS